MRHHQSIYSKDGHIVQVKDGFCWGAFFFGCVWFLYKRLWTAGISWLVFIILIGIVKNYLQQQPDFNKILPISTLVFITYSIVQGVTANPVLIKHLQKKGYVKIG